MAMLIPTLPGWKVETVGDDIAWMKFGDDGRLYAINPEAGFFGVAPGTGEDTNPNAMRTLDANSHLHQRRPHRRRRRLVGGPDRRAAGPPHRLEGQRLDARRPTRRPPTPTPASPPRRRSARRSPPSGRTPKGVPISAILFGGRRATNVPLVTEAFDWQHGVFLGSIMSSEKTAAAAGAVGELRFDPFAMLPFCGYNMGDYFAHWLEIGAARPTRPSCPSSSGSTGSARATTASSSGPGFGENSRVLKWVVERVNRGRRGRRHRHRQPARGGSHRPDASASASPTRTGNRTGRSAATSPTAASCRSIRLPCRASRPGRRPIPPS